MQIKDFKLIIIFAWLTLILYLKLSQAVAQQFLIGENGTGKSTMIECV